MEKILDPPTPEALHVELCTAIADLAKSVDVAVTHMALRSKCTTAIADAAKVERAAEALRAAALEAEKAEPQEITLVPAELAAEKARQPIEPATPEPACAEVDELYAACSWLAMAQASRSAAEGQGSRQESIIAMRILELQQRMGGLIKK